MDPIFVVFTQPTFIIVTQKVFLLLLQYIMCSFITSSLLSFFMHGFPPLIFNLFLYILANSVKPDALQYLYLELKAIHTLASAVSLILSYFHVCVSSDLSNSTTFHLLYFVIMFVWFVMGEQQYNFTLLTQNSCFILLIIRKVLREGII